MSDDKKRESKEENKDQKPSVLDWLIHGKGSVSDPWPTVKEVLEDQSVKEEIAKVKNTFDEQLKNKE